MALVRFTSAFHRTLRSDPSNEPSLQQAFWTRTGPEIPIEYYTTIDLNSGANKLWFLPYNNDGQRNFNKLVNVFIPNLGVSTLNLAAWAPFSNEDGLAIFADSTEGLGGVLMKKSEFEGISKSGRAVPEPGWQRQLEMDHYYGSSQGPSQYQGHYGSSTQDPSQYQGYYGSSTQDPSQYLGYYGSSTQNPSQYQGHYGNHH